MANTDNNTIQLDISSSSKYLEAMSNSVVDVFPGELMEYTSDGKVTTHSIADGTQNSIFAVENSYSGSDIYTPYVIATRVMMRQCRKGDRVLAVLAPGNTTVIGSLLSSSGDGSLKLAQANPIDGSVAGVATEAVTAVTDSEYIIITIN